MEDERGTLARATRSEAWGAVKVRVAGAGEWGERGAGCAARRQYDLIDDLFWYYDV